MGGQPVNGKRRRVAWAALAVLSASVLIAFLWSPATPRFIEHVGQVDVPDGGALALRLYYRYPMLKLSSIQPTALVSEEGDRIQILQVNGNDRTTIWPTRKVDVVAVVIPGFDGEIVGIEYSVSGIVHTVPIGRFRIRAVDGQYGDAGTGNLVREAFRTQAWQWRITIPVPRGFSIAGVTPLPGSFAIEAKVDAAGEMPFVSLDISPSASFDKRPYCLIYRPVISGTAGGSKVVVPGPTAQVVFGLPFPRAGLDRLVK